MIVLLFIIMIRYTAGMMPMIRKRQKTITKRPPNLRLTSKKLEKVDSAIT